MIFLLLSIFSSSAIYLLFKIAGKYKTHLFSIITINYFFASLTGITVQNEQLKWQAFQSEWIYIALIIGSLFVIMFFLIGISTQKIGITYSTLATRMSMIIPIAVSLFIYSEIITLSKIFILLLALIGVVMAIYTKPKKEIKRWQIFLPFILFLGSGTVDALVKVAQNSFVPENQLTLFSGALFLTSFIIALSITAINKKFKQLLQPANLLFGILLGLVNWGSLFFIMSALNKSQLDSSFVFAANNVAIVTLSTLVGLFYFREKITPINGIGILISIVTLFLILK